MLSSLGGGIMQGIGGYQSAQAQAASAKYNSQVAVNNATIAQQNAQLAIEQGAAAESKKRQETAGLIGAQNAQFAANGINVNSGSAVDVKSSAAITGELDALTIRSNALRQANNYTNQANAYDSSAQLLSDQAQWAQGMGDTGVAGSILSTAGNVGSKWLTMKQTGAS